MFKKKGTFAQALADALPPDKGDPPSGYYPDPFGSPMLREWDGAGWTQSVRKLDPASAEPASAFTRYQLVVPRKFHPADPYVISEEETGGERYEVPRGRSLNRQLRVLDKGGVEVARLGRWGRELIRGDEVVGAITPGEQDQYSLRTGNVRTVIVGNRKRREHYFVRGLEGRLVGRLTKRERFGRTYDLEIAESIDPVPIVAACIAIHIHRAEGSAFGGGGFDGGG